MGPESLAGPGPPGARRLRNLHRITYVDVVLLLLRLGVVAVVVGGTIGTLIKGTYTSAQWFDLFMFGLTIGASTG